MRPGMASGLSVRASQKLKPAGHPRGCQPVIPVFRPPITTFLRGLGGISCPGYVAFDFAEEAVKSNEGELSEGAVGTFGRLALFDTAFLKFFLGGGGDQLQLNAWDADTRPWQATPDVQGTNLHPGFFHMHHYVIEKHGVHQRVLTGRRKRTAGLGFSVPPKMSRLFPELRNRAGGRSGLSNVPRRPGMQDELPSPRSQ